MKNEKLFNRFLARLFEATKLERQIELYGQYKEFDSKVEKLENTYNVAENLILELKEVLSDLDYDWDNDEWEKFYNITREAREEAEEEYERDVEEILKNAK